ncbi:uncharacterized protein LOC141723822 isoform X2 [Apium graveolens]|uniref:uncharacterized protein LOC141723822 isoform X2 n=1 Tax=Apium graveolens TaxID=4045 RepID=UPI003D792671
MDSEDLLQLPDSGKSGIESESNDLPFTDCESGAAASLPNSAADKDQMNENFTHNGVDVGEKTKEAEKVQMNENVMQNGGGNGEKTEDGELIVSTAAVQVSVQLAEKIDIKEKVHSISSMVHIENGCEAVEGQSSLFDLKNEENSISIKDKDTNLTGVKRPREAIDEQPPSIHVLYNSLPRDSKQKLDKLLQQWSEWHARHYPSSIESAEDLESGETTYFPALHVGEDKSSAVSFWVDNQTRGPQSKDVMLDHDSVPLYDRGYTMGLIPSDGSGNAERGLEIFNASRCFNCGSYNHSLKECPKPRDNVAVSNARKELKSKRNQSAGSRNPTRYYQSSPGGKYDGLRPGTLDVETRKLLGLGELDPPPWLNRMREIGYPPGYLDPEEKDQPSGITIFSFDEEENKDDTEDGEILDTDDQELPKKKSVEFPGINGPIPGNADEKHWTAVQQSHDMSRERPSRRFNHSSESFGKYYQEQRWTRDLRDDGPPGVDPPTNPSLSSYPPRYSAYDSGYSSYSPRGNISRPRSPSFDRSQSDRSRRSPLIHESSKYSSQSTSAESPTYRMSSQQKYSSASLDDEDNGRWNDYTPETSSHRKDKRDHQYHHSKR